jgi:hypothetical protein
MNILLIPENHGCAYSIDTEGELYYAPQYQDGTVNVEEFDFVDYESMDDDERNEVEKVHNQLIDVMKTLGYYYKN